MALLFQDKVKNNQTQFITGVNAVANRLGIYPNWLMALINSETAGTFSPSIQNPYTNATGLIQFMPNTAKGLGTSIDKLKAMSNVEQLKYVEAYFKPYVDHINSFEDLYLITFYPNAGGVFAATLSKPDNWKFPASITGQNPGLDTDKDGYISIKEFRDFAYRKVPDHLQNMLFQVQRKVRKYKGLVALVALALIILAIWYGKKKSWIAFGGR